MVNKFPYLGTKFSCERTFKLAAQEIIKKGKMGTIAAKNILGAGKSWNISGNFIATTPYSTEIWGLMDSEMLEKRQLNYIKSIFCYSINTPNSML